MCSIFTTSFYIYYKFSDLLQVFRFTTSFHIYYKFSYLLQVFIFTTTIPKTKEMFLEYLFMIIIAVMYNNAIQKIIHPIHNQTYYNPQNTILYQYNNTAWIPYEPYKTPSEHIYQL